MSTQTILQPEPERSYATLQEFENLVSNGLQRFYRRVYRQLGNIQDAEDAVQDGLFCAYKNLSQFRGTAQLSTWLMSIIANAARMQQRKKRLVRFHEELLGKNEEGMTLLEAFEDKQPGPEEICAKAELRTLLINAVNQLPPASRRTVEAYMSAMPAVRASEALGIPGGTIKARVARARGTLTKLLRQETQRRRAAVIGRRTR